MKYQIMLDKKPDHCLRCLFRDRVESDGCILQYEDNGENVSPHYSCIEFENWEKQMEHCPVVAVDLAPTKEGEKVVPDSANSATSSGGYWETTYVPPPEMTFGPAGAVLAPKVKP